MILALLLQAAAPIDTIEQDNEPEAAKGVLADQAVEMPDIKSSKVFRQLQRAKRSQEAGASLQSLTMDYLLWIDPKGKVETCVPLRVFGLKSFALKTCKRLKRLKATPAKGTDGKAIHTAYSSQISLNYVRRRSEIDDLRVGQRFDLELPFEKFRPYPLVTATVQVEADGSVSYCRANWKAQSEKEAEINLKICDFLETTALHIRQDNSGTPVRYLRTVTVKLTG